MKSTVVFTAGFATGWLARSAVDSSQGAAVTLLAFLMDTMERVKRLTAIERERLDDLMAEARAQVNARKAARAARSSPSEPTMEHAA